MTKKWILRAVALLETSLTPIPQELNELDWKENISPDNKKLGKHLSAFANYPGGGFLVFGIKNIDASVVGVSKEKAEIILSKIGNIARDVLEPVISIEHSIEKFENQSLLFVYIKESATKPVHIKSKSIEETYIRSAGATKKASRPEIGGLMLNSKTPTFEELHSSKLKSNADILNILDYRTIFGLLKRPIPNENNEVLDFMAQEKMIEEYDTLGYYITNFGALASAYNLSDFDGLTRKSIRLVKYKGINKVIAEKEYPGSKGYAISFESLINFIQALLPSSEVIKKAFRTETSIYPDIALRELIANALIHQDFTVRGSGPMIEIFSDRIEISNPGKLLPSKRIDRLIRTTPESRNEILAKAFRRYNICEERGSGLEKSVAAIELYGLPPLKFEELANSFRVTMYSPKSFKELTPVERIEAAYQHSVLRHFSSSAMSNTSLRERFKVSERYRSQVSLVIKEALEQNRIKHKDPTNTSTKFAEYVPIWA
ncbi:MAG: ATP-binding protein [Psychroserpens sp.]|uniref:ATP-binding protein n=1 Tax=Psychroserpens sp. TaxID=2020870 RepID=UPI003C73F1ED